MAVQFPCQNPVCGLMLELKEIPAPEIVNAKSFSGAIWPVFGVTCNGCGSFHRAHIKQAQINLSLGLVIVEKREPSPIIAPEWKG